MGRRAEIRVMLPCTMEYHRLAANHQKLEQRRERAFLTGPQKPAHTPDLGFLVLRLRPIIPIFPCHSVCGVLLRQPQETPGTPDLIIPWMGRTDLDFLYTAQRWLGAEWLAADSLGTGEGRDCRKRSLEPPSSYPRGAKGRSLLQSRPSTMGTQTPKAQLSVLTNYKH